MRIYFSLLSLIVSALILATSEIHSQSVKMCITVDDLPTVSYTQHSPDLEKEITDKLVAAFKQNNVPAIGYVNERKLYLNESPDPGRVELLEKWLTNGLELGNHSFSHLNYHRVSYDSFTSDVIRGEKIIRNLASQYDQEISFFRHPYLRIGENSGRADSLTAFLKQQGYTEAPVTIDNEDYLFAHAYSRARDKNDQALMKRIGGDYVKYMEEKLEYFERQSRKLFNREIGQILLIHASLLNADYVSELLSVYKTHGYSFVSQEEILKDPAYQERVTAYGDYGISWIDRWALSRGKKGEFFAGDPETPAYIRAMTE